MLLEEITLVSSIALIAENKITFEAAFIACLLGINVGNILNYYVGFFVSRMNPHKRFNFLKKHEVKISEFKDSSLLTYWIVISKLVPGTRFVTYFAAGYLKYPFGKYLALTFLSAFAVTSIVLWAGEGFRQLFKTHWILSVILLALILIVLKFTLQKLKKTWKK